MLTVEAVSELTGGIPKFGLFRAVLIICPNGGAKGFKSFMKDSNNTIASSDLSAEIDSTTSAISINLSQQDQSFQAPIPKASHKLCDLYDVGTPEQLELRLAKAGYHCMPFYASQLSLVLNTPSENVKSLLLEGPPGCGKSYLAKSLAKITGAELMCLSCFKGMNLQHLIEQPSTLAMVNAMAGKETTQEQLLNLGILSKAYLKSQTHPVILLIDEIDKVESAIDTFFLGPIQDARIWLESRAPIDANTDNLLIVLTKNFERSLGDALMRRVHPMRMDYMSTKLERKVLEPHCDPRITKNLVRLAEIMRNREGSYPFERPPAPEELLRAGRFLHSLLDWELIDFTFVGRNLFYALAKQDHDRVILEQMLRYHPDFQDPLVPDNRNAPMDEVFARLGRVLLDEIVSDPLAEQRRKAYRPEKTGLTSFESPDEMVRRLSAVGYQCQPFLAAQLSLLLTTPLDRVRSTVLEGPSGCGKSYFAKCLAKISGAELMCMSCYAGMNTQHLIEVPSALQMARSVAGVEDTPKEKLMNLGVLSRAFLKSQSQPIILLIDEIDKADASIDTFFLGPIQDGRIWLESRPPIDANLDNLLVIFTKNFNRTLDDALLRRLLPVRMNYLDSALERRVLSNYCLPKLVSNLVGIADIMRESDGAYQFERPPAPEELVTAGKYILKLIEWKQTDFAWIGKNVWAILAKSEHDRAVLEHMLRFHPDFMDPLNLDARNAHIEEIHARLGRVVLQGIIEDPDSAKRERAWQEVSYY